MVQLNDSTDERHDEEGERIVLPPIRKRRSQAPMEQVWVKIGGLLQH